MHALPVASAMSLWSHNSTSVLRTETSVLVDAPPLWRESVIKEVLQASNE